MKKFDPRYARLFGTDGRVYTTWLLPQGFSASLPQQLRHEARHPFVVHRVEFLDAEERPLANWFAEYHMPLRGGDSLVVDVAGFDIQE